MGLAAQIAEAAGITTLKTGTIDLIASKDVEAFLRTARRFRVAIVGMEGFRVDAKSTIPDMSAIGDFSELLQGSDVVEKSVREARRFFMQTSKPEMFFDFELESQEPSVD